MPPGQQPFVSDYSRHMAESFRQWTKQPLIESTTPEALYYAPFVLVSHGIQPDPVFCYANLAAQKLWGMSWEQFTALPSRFSAEPDARDERERLLQRAEAQGYVDDYQGIRITADGRRFRIRNCILWNVVNETGDKIGQAAKFATWEWIPAQGGDDQ